MRSVKRSAVEPVFRDDRPSDATNQTRDDNFHRRCRGHCHSPIDIVVCADIFHLAASRVRAGGYGGCDQSKICGDLSLPYRSSLRRESFEHCSWITRLEAMSCLRISLNQRADIPDLFI